MTNLIYALIDPRTGQVCYIGKSKRGLSRAAAHTSPSSLKKDFSNKGLWIKELAKGGSAPIVKVLEEVSSESGLNDAERFWISRFKDYGVSLTNMTSGGDGNANHRAEWLAALSERMKDNKYAAGCIRNEAWIARQSARMRGNQYVAGRVIPEDERDRRGEAIARAIAAKTPEERAAHAAAISEAKQGSPGNLDNLAKGWEPEVRARAVKKSANLRRGVAETDEHRQAIADGLKRAYADGKRKPLTSEQYLKGRWSMKHDACVSCQTTDKPHKGGGLCTRCWEKRRSVTRKR